MITSVCSANQSHVPSVEPPSTTTISIEPLNLFFLILSIVAFISFFLFFDPKTTDISYCPIISITKGYKLIIFFFII